MLNIHRYLSCYEDLNLWTEKDKHVDGYKENLQKLRSTLPKSDNESLETSDNDSSYQYATILFHSLLQVISNHDLDSIDNAKEELISINQFNLLIKILQEGVKYGLDPYLPEYFVAKMRVVTPKLLETEMNEEAKLRRLSESTGVLIKILRCKRISAHSGLEFDLLKLLFCHFFLKSNGIEVVNDLNDIFRNRSLLFQHLMLLKGLPGVSKDISISLHKALLDQLSSKGGFEIFSRLMLAKTDSQTGEEWRTYEIVSKIVAARGHTKGFYLEMIEQITEFLKSCVGVKDLQKFIPICVTCLQKLAALSIDMTKVFEEKLLSWLQNLSEPPEILTGVVIMTEQQFSEALNLINVCFGGSSIVSLPSKMLVTYYRVLFGLYSIGGDHERKLLSPILMYFFNNRESKELKSFISAIVFGEETQEKALFDRVVIKNGPEGSSLVISAPDETPYVDVASTFGNFLIQSGNMLLVNDVFMALLELLGSSDAIKSTKGDLLFEEDEQLGALLSSKFMKRLVLIELLQTLINCKQFQAHINGDPGKILDFVKEMLSKEVQKTENSAQETTMLLLSIFKELLLCVRNKEIEADMLKFVREIQKSNKNSGVKSHLTALFSDQTSKPDLQDSKYNSALSLLNQPEIYLKVYGIQQLIHLLNQKDPETIANKHVILILSLKNLKIDESYAYLNSIRLILALTNVMEPEVIDALIAEFENQELDVDFRMKIGETTVKIAEALGPITFKYKKDLVNCFLRGCLNVKPELRASSLSNMGSICKILTYQVANFFQEILLIIHQTLQTDTFLPARRSAVMVLSQFLQGMDKIIDYQECLLPIYRTLKYVLRTEEDEVTRMHAALSIETLNQKVKEMLVGELVQPEIELKIKNVAESKKINVKYK